MGRDRDEDYADGDYCDMFGDCMALKKNIIPHKECVKDHECDGGERCDPGICIPPIPRETDELNFFNKDTCQKVYGLCIFETGVQ